MKTLIIKNIILGSPNYIVSLLLAFIVFFSSCKVVEEISYSNMVSFDFKKMYNCCIESDATGTIQGDSIVVIVPFSTDITKLVASFEIPEGITVLVNEKKQLSSSTTNDFSNTVIYSIVSPDGNKKNFRVIVRKSDPLAGNDILSFVIKASSNKDAGIDKDIVGTINHDTIGVTFSAGVDFTRNIVVDFTNSDGSTVFVGDMVQTSGVSENLFSNLLHYKVSSQSGVIKTYIISIRIKSNQKEFLSFGFNDITPLRVYENQTESEYAFIIDSSIDIKKLTASFTTSPLVQYVKVKDLSQISGETVNDFTTMVTYEITAEDGSNKFYNVYVTSTSDLILAGGKFWMNKNLGSAKVAVSPTDQEAYGYLYQWGRGNDGHQLTNSTLRSGQQTTYANKGSIFYYKSASEDWRSNNLIPTGDDWAEVDNPCPCGFTVASRQDWIDFVNGRTGSTDNGDFKISYGEMRLTSTGYRNSTETRRFGGGIGNYGEGTGYSWLSNSSSSSSGSAQYVTYDKSKFNGVSGTAITLGRSVGMSVRCVEK